MSGGGGGSSTSMPVLPTQYRGYTDQLLKKSFRTLGENLKGPLVAGRNENIQTGQNMALEAARQQLPALQQQQSSIFGNLASMGDWQNNPALQAQMQQVAQNATEAMRENILPALRTGAVQAGQVGSSRQGIAEGLAARDTARQIGQQQTGLLANAYQQAMGANQAALGFTPQLQEAALKPASIFSQVGAQQRGIEQELLDEKLKRQEANLQRLTGLGNIYGSATAPLVGQTSSSQSAPSLFDKAMNLSTFGLWDKL